jgi:hypothetical protein
MDAIRPDEDVARSAVCEPDAHASGVVIEAVDMRAQLEAIVAEGAEEDIEQIGTMGVVVR